MMPKVPRGEKDGGRGEEETAPRAATFTLARTEKSRGCDVDENQIFCEEDEISSSHRRVCQLEPSQQIQSQLMETQYRL